MVSRRAREEELLYVLRKLLELRLWPGTFWAAMSDSPSEYYLEQPGKKFEYENSVGFLRV